MNPAQVDAYLSRIGAQRPALADGAALRELQERHLFAVPFENLSIHLGEPITLEEGALFEKVVARRRGGFCYELNGAFAALLSTLGFRVTLLAARAYGKDGLGPPFDHLALRVDVAEPWLVDVGFGSLSRYPLRIDLRTDQADPDGTLRIAEGEAGDLDVSRDGLPQYRLEPRPRALADFVPTCWWHQTSPRSHFTQSTVCTLPRLTGRVTLGGRTLTETVGRDRSEQLLRSDDEVLAAYRTHFGIILDHVPGNPRAAGLL